MSYIPKTDYEYLCTAFGLDTSGTINSSCEDAGIAGKTIQVSVKGENGTEIAFTAPFAIFWADGQDPNNSYCKLKFQKGDANTNVKVSREWYLQYYTIFEVDEEQKLSFELGQNA